MVNEDQVDALTWLWGRIIWERRLDELRYVADGVATAVNHANDETLNTERASSR